ncbi:MAG: LamG domain-containing protein, partial [Candidatus Omnitrophota bacterium]
MVHHLQEASGTHYDSTANNHDSTGIAATQGVTGKINGADSFDGASDYVQIGSFNVEEITVEAWVKFDAFTEWDVVVSKPWTPAGSPYAVWNITLQDGTSSRGGYPAGYRLASKIAYDATDRGNIYTRTISTNTWYYVTQTWKKNSTVNHSLYLNGVFYSSQDLADGNSLYSNAVDIYIGHNMNNGDQDTDGIIDEVRVSNTPRSADWILAQYKSMSGVFINKGSVETGGVNTGFSNVTTPADTAPFNSGDTVKYTAQAGDTFFANGKTIYWRARAKDPAGSNAWTSYSAPRSFTIDTSVTTPTWFQTKTGQFNTGAFVNNVYAGSGDDVRMSSYGASSWWSTNYAKRIPINLTGGACGGYPVLLSFDSTTTPRASDLYSASKSSVKGDDFRIVYNGSEIDRHVESFTSSSVRIWFGLQAALGTFKNLIDPANGGAFVSGTTPAAGSWNNVNNNSWASYCECAPPTPYAIYSFNNTDTKTIYKIRINPNNSTATNPGVRDFRFLVSTTGTAEGDFTTIVDSTMGTTIRRYTDFTFTPVQAKYVKIILDSNQLGSGNILIDELEVYEYSTDTSNYKLYYDYASASSPPADLWDVFPPGRDANTKTLLYCTEGSGTILNDSSSAGTGGMTLYNTPTWENTFGLSNNYSPKAMGPYFVDFNSSQSEYGQTGTVFPKKHLTCEYWVKIGSTGNTYSAAYAGSTMWAHQWYYEYQQSFMYWCGVNQGVGFQPGVSSTEFWHVAFVQNDTTDTMEYWMDGVMRSQVASNSTADSGLINFKIFYDSYVSRYASGKMGTLRISDTPRTNFDYGRKSNQTSCTLGVIESYSSGGATGALTSPTIDFDDGTGTWDYISWTDTETNGDIKYQVLYWDGDSWELVPDAALSGNSTGFDASPIDISGLNTTTYNQIRIKANFTYSGGTPILSDWTCCWCSDNTPPIIDSRGISPDGSTVYTASRHLPDDAVTSTTSYIYYEGNASPDKIWYGNDMSVNQTFYWAGTAHDNVGGTGLQKAVFVKSTQLAGGSSEPVDDASAANWAGAYDHVGSGDTDTDVTLGATLYDNANKTTAVNFTVYRDATNPVAGTVAWTSPADGARLQSSSGNYRVYRSGQTVYYSAHASGETTQVTMAVSGASDANSGLWKYQYPNFLDIGNGRFSAGNCTYTIGNASVSEQVSPTYATAYDNVCNSANTAAGVALNKDTTAPAPNSPATETHGAASGVAQSITNDPAFTWTCSADSEAGIWGYDWYFGTNSGGTPANWVLSGACDPSAVDSYNRYYLNVQTKDNVSNTSSIVQLFVFIYFPSVPSLPGLASWAPTPAKSMSAWYQGVKASSPFTFSPSSEMGTKFSRYFYKWTTTQAEAPPSDGGSGYNVTTSDTAWAAGSINLTPANGRHNWLHIRAANSNNDLSDQSDIGPFYFVDTSRLMKHGKFFDDEGNPIEMGPKSP